MCLCQCPSILASSDRLHVCSQGRNESSPTTHGRYEYIVYRDKDPVLL